MRDWQTLARVLAADVPAEQIEKVTPSLDALEVAFRPLLERLTDTVEPAICFVARGTEKR